jgi:RNA 2',3'-cyclic 3'-phosphodiesterase
MRLFLAVFPSSEAQLAAHALIESLRQPGDGVSWVKRENLHYTLRFLGEVGDDGARRATEGAQEAAAGAQAFTAALGGLGAFPSSRRARVLWLGMSQGAGALEALARELERALERRGFAPEGRRFSAHLTLGRVREGRGGGEADWTQALAEAEGVAAAGPPFAVDRIAVVESRLDPRGSIYTVRAEGRLGG